MFRDSVFAQQERRPPKWELVGRQDGAQVFEFRANRNQRFALAPFPGRATAVERYAPNLPLARRRREPLGVRVFEANTRTGMPLEACAFDLVLNRHGGFKAREMHRILPRFAEEGDHEVVEGAAAARAPATTSPI
jgi:hypothetical protein